MSNTELGGWLSNSKGVKIMPAHSDSVMPVKTGINLRPRFDAINLDSGLRRNDNKGFEIQSIKKGPLILSGLFLLKTSDELARLSRGLSEKGAHFDGRLVAVFHRPTGQRLAVLP